MSESLLTNFDEYLIHQITDSFGSVAATDKHWNDGHYICLCDADGKIQLIGLVRLYTNNDVIDGFLCVRHEGKQHNIRLSRRLRSDVNTIGIGPLRIEIVEPMETVRLVLEENEYGISCDLTCRTTSVPYEDTHSYVREGGRFNRSRAVYEVVGTVEGSVTVAGETYKATADKWFFFRNHSWGSMPGRGGPRDHGAPPQSPQETTKGLRQWVLFRMPDHGGFYQIMDRDDGERLQQEGAILLSDSQLEVTEIDHDLEFYSDGPKRLKSGRFSLTDQEGTRREYELEDLGWVYCQGGGYFGGFNDGLGQGVWRGEYHAEGEVWDASHPQKIVEADGTEREFDHAWAESFTLLRSGNSLGLAHFEAVVFE
ncbi:MAG TPA: hypothetical protein DGL25_00165 [Dehalococcoidia bacterium]|nr:hypothetical protein [Dehalococcoidia bacterium]